MNEHEMQTVLTARWLENGLTIQGQKLFLAAWEVMTADWRMNRWGGRWSPSVDFWLLDVNGGCWLLEFKPKLTGAAESWSALCQVTHRAVLLARSYQFSKLERVYEECRQTSPRSTDRLAPKPLLEAHRTHFHLERSVEPESVGAESFRRVVGAQRFGEGFQLALSAFNGRNHAGVMELLKRSGYKLNLENKRNERTRFASIGDWGATLAPSVSFIEIGPIIAD